MKDQTKWLSQTKKMYGGFNQPVILWELFEGLIYFPINGGELYLEIQNLEEWAGCTELIHPWSWRVGSWKMKPFPLGAWYLFRGELYYLFQGLVSTPYSLDVYFSEDYARKLVEKDWNLPASGGGCIHEQNHKAPVKIHEKWQQCQGGKQQLYTLPKANSPRPLKYRPFAPKGKDGLPTASFQGLIMLLWGRVFPFCS